MTSATRIGLVVNPIAGMGGSVGLKGTDGAAALRRARELGAGPRSSHRAAAALAPLGELVEVGRVRLLTGRGPMGDAAAVEAGVRCDGVRTGQADETTAADTQRAVHQMLDDGVALLLFAGGDGTARDVLEAVGTRVPVIGIPTGVKIHSAVFAVSPEAAGALAARFVTGSARTLREAEVMDIDEEAVRAGRVAAKLVGYMAVPQDDGLVQGPKARALSEREVRASIAKAVVAEMDPEAAYVIGPGTTTAAVMEAMDLQGTLLGVDVVRAGRLVATDSSERRLLELLRGAPAKIVVSPIGGQGFLFGRGNQQISARVIAEVGPRNVLAIASDAKLASLRGKPLRVDLDDPSVSASLGGFMRVLTGEGEHAMYPVAR